MWLLFTWWETTSPFAAAAETTRTTRTISLVIILSITFQTRDHEISTAKKNKQTIKTLTQCISAELLPADPTVQSETWKYLIVYWLAANMHKWCRCWGRSTGDWKRPTQEKKTHVDTKEPGVRTWNVTFGSSFPPGAHFCPHSNSPGAVLYRWLEATIPYRGALRFVPETMPRLWNLISNLHTNFCGVHLRQHF